MLVFLAVLGFLGADAPKDATPPWPLPWKEGVSYELTWYEKEPLGKSVFVCRWSDDKKSIVCKGKLDLGGRVGRLEGEFATVFAPDLSPKSHVGVFKTSDKGIGAGVAAAFTPEEIRVTLGLAKDAPVKKLTPPKERYWLYGHQAIHHWAIFLTAVDTQKPSVLKVCMPDFLQFCDIAFTPEGTEEIRGVTATRLAFNAQGMFQGKVWVGPDKRLLRYQQKNSIGFTEIWVDEKR